MENPYLAPQTSLEQATDDIAKQLEGIQYPLTLSFKILALASQATVKDATGRTVLYTKQKMFKFREHVEIFTESDRKVLLAEIKTNKVIDWSARYNFTDAKGAEIGSVGRKGWRSLWRAHYEVFNPGHGDTDFTIREENVASKVMDSLLGEIPIIGFLTGYFFHPKYLATRSGGEGTMRITKQPAFWEGRFKIENKIPFAPRSSLVTFFHGSHRGRL